MMNWLRQRKIGAATLLLLTLLSAPAACGPAGEPEIVRLVGPIPVDRFAFGRASIEEVFRYRFERPDDLSAWVIRADQLAEIRDGALQVAGAERSSLIRDVDFPAADVDGIEVRLEGLQRGVTRLFWAREDERFSPDRRVVLRAGDGVDGVYRFPVGEHPEWAGRIRSFRVDATTYPNELVRVASIAGVHTGDDLRAEAFDRVWAIEAGNELRAGALVTADRAYEQPLVTVVDARLHFAFALLNESLERPARFSIARVDGGAEREIWAGEAASPDTGWLTDSVAIGSTDGDPATLRFAVDCADADRCVGAFGSMEVRPPVARERPNVVLISIDTLRADRMSLYGNDKPTTPRIDAWAGAAGVAFEQAVAAAPWTLPSHASMFTGMSATTHNANYNTPVPESLEMLAERLRADGYFTAAVTGGGYVAPEFGFRQGFDVYASWERGADAYQREHPASGTELPANLGRARQILREAADRPLFLFFHTYEVHGPFHPQMPYFERFYPDAGEHPGLSVSSRRAELEPDGGYKLVRELFVSDEGDWRRLQPDELPQLRALYDSGVAYTDAHIGELLDEIGANGMLDDTLVVLTSDHGEMLGERDLGGHAYLYEPNLRIPLVISWPGRFPGGLRVEDQVGTVDIVPTVLDLLGHGPPPEIDGESLVPLLEGRSMSRSPEIITYAGASNHGVSLRFDNGLKYVYENALWRAGNVHSLAPIDPTSSAASLDFSARAAELRREVEQLLEARPGLHMLLVNEDGPEEIVFRFQGPPMQRDRIKATRLECRCAAWLGGSRSEVRVPAGREIAIQVEDPPPGVIRIEAAIGDDVYRDEIDIGSIEEPFVIDRRDGGWQRISLRDELVSRGLAIWWQGSARGTGGAPMDEELMRQLEALGYLR